MGGAHMDGPPSTPVQTPEQQAAPDAASQDAPVARQACPLEEPPEEAPEVPPEVALEVEPEVPLEVEAEVAPEVPDEAREEPLDALLEDALDNPPDDPPSGLSQTLLALQTSPAAAHPPSARQAVPVAGVAQVQLGPTSIAVQPSRVEDQRRSQRTRFVDIQASSAHGGALFVSPSRSSV